MEATSRCLGQILVNGITLLMFVSKIEMKSWRPTIYINVRYQLKNDNNFVNKLVGDQLN